MHFFVLALILSVAVHSEISEFEFFQSRCDYNCTFEPYYLDSESIKVFPKNCPSVCAYLTIDGNSDVTEKQLATAFKNVKTLYGFLKVLRTNFKSAKFLLGLEVLECDSDSELAFHSNFEMTEIGMINLKSTSCDIRIDNNPKLEKLNLPKLKNFYTVFLPPRLSIGITYKLCVTIEEMTHFLTSEVLEMWPFNMQYCNVSSIEIAKFEEKICELLKFDLKTFDPACKRVIGNVFIGPGDEENVGKLKNLTWIYGRLIINGTQISKIDFLDNLKYVAYFEDDQYATYILNNKNLVEASFPKLKLIRTLNENSRQLVFHDNNPELSSDSEFCFRLKNELNTTKQYIPEIDGRSCELHGSCSTVFCMFCIVFITITPFINVV